MTFISNAILRKKHAQTDRDIYYQNLEEAYGNLPVPNDDWADIKQLIEKQAPELDAEEEIDNLEGAIEIIRNHYELVAKLLGKEQKYN